MGFDESEKREDGQRPQWLTKVFPALPERSSSSSKSPHDASQDYLVGMRGVLAIMTWLWVFMRVFAPAAEDASANTTGPAYQMALRKSLSVFFWNGSLIYSSIIFLSARTICLPFLLDSTKVQLASSVFRRGFRLWLPSGVALIACYIVFTKTLGTDYLTDFANLTANASLDTDLYVMPSSLANFNSFFYLFWQTHNFSKQAGNWAFPSQTLWIVSAIFQQSYTVYMVMVIVPFTRKSWRLWGAFIFIITAWWVYSWAWFSISGLLLADLVVNFDFKKLCQEHRLVSLAVAAVCLVAGFAMQFIWVAALPDLQNAEINYHTGLYTTGGIYTWNDTTSPQLRADDYLAIVGFYILLESSDILQMVFRNPVFVYLGKRSYSWYLLSSIIIYTLGIQTCMNMIGDSLDDYSKASGVAFIACLLVTAAAAEAFYWLFEVPSQWLGHFTFDWIRE